VPASWAGRDLRLSLGAVDDFDTTYYAGEEVGRTGRGTPGYLSVPRRYTVPGRLVTAGRTVIAVRAFDHYGGGGFAGVAPEMTLSPAEGAGTAISLAGAWRYRVERLPPRPPISATQPRFRRRTTRTARRCCTAR
jgi:sialate O-acetylesterase